MKNHERRYSRSGETSSSLTSSSLSESSPLTMTSNDENVRTYAKRYLVLCLTVYHIGIVSFQTTQYSSISDSISVYYGVNEEYIILTGSVFALVYITLFSFVNHPVKRFGLRTSIVIAFGLNAFGSIVKIYSVNPSGFFILLVGQLISAVSLTMTLVMSSTIISAWFGANEVTFAKSLIMAFMPIGMGLTFILPSITNLTNVQIILFQLTWIMAIVSILTLLIVVLFVDDKPPIPPSFAEKEKKINEDWRALLTNRNYLQLLTGYTIISTLSMILIVLMNQAVLNVFPGQHTVVSISGFMVTFTGTLSPLFGRWLDKTKLFKLWANTSSFTVFAGIVGIWLSLAVKSIPLFYIATLCTGLGFAAFLPIAPDVSVEITYPLCEAYVIGFLMFPSQLLSFVGPPLLSLLITHFGTLYSMAFLTVSGAISWIAIVCIQWELKRNNVENGALLSKTGESHKMYSSQLI